MVYIDGFVVPVKTARKEDYRKMAAEMGQMFLEFGALQSVECWGDDVPKGKLTDFQGAVKAEDDETVVFSWVVWPSKEARDAGNDKMMSDPRMKMPDDLPFSAKRMIYGGFAPIVDTKDGV